MECEIEEINTGEEILCISTTPAYILFGGSSRKFCAYGSVKSVLWEHKKSVRSADSVASLFGCASYDGTAAIFKDGTFFETVEGPDTEVKRLCFSEDGKFLAMSTRGKTVWVCKIGDEIEIDAVLEDHLHDVKGVKFSKGNLYSFGYDNTIKMYERFNLDDSWVLIQSLNEGGTVWDIGFCEDLMISCNEDGRIRQYEFTHEWCLLRSVVASIYPIYAMAVFGNTICYVLNRDSLAVLNMKLVETFVEENLGEITCIHFCRYRDVVLCGLTNGTIKILRLRKECHHLPWDTTFVRGGL